MAKVLVEDIKPMKAQSLNENPEQVRKILREWRVTTSLPPRFTENVWRRIENAEREITPAARTTAWAVISAWITSALPRPAFAVAYVSVLLVAGLLAGYWHAQSDRTNWDKTLASRYVQSVDPFGR